MNGKIPKPEWRNAGGNMDTFTKIAFCFFLISGGIGLILISLSMVLEAIRK